MHVNAGDAAWMLAATAMVFFMMPGLALFYGGLVDERHGISDEVRGHHSGPDRSSLPSNCLPADSSNSYDTRRKESHIGLSRCSLPSRTSRRYSRRVDSV